MSLTFLTPLAALIALGVLVPVAVLFVTGRHARGVRAGLGVDEPGLRRLLVALGSIVVAGVLVGLAAAQPIFERDTELSVRTDAEVFVVLDITRSMLAQESPSDPMRIDRAKEAASAFRSSLPTVRVGLASLTDRLLPHLFPSPSEDVFEATLERAVDIERPPPRSGFSTNVTALDALATIRGLSFYSPSARKRLVVVFTDGESLPVSHLRLGGVFRKPPGDRDDLRPRLGRRRERLQPGRPRAAVQARPGLARAPRAAREIDARSGRRRGRRRRRRPVRAQLPR